jgi:hypothetical protein
MGMIRNRDDLPKVVGITRIGEMCEGSFCIGKLREDLVCSSDLGENWPDSCLGFADELRFGWMPSCNIQNLMSERCRVSVIKFK